MGNGTTLFIPILIKLFLHDSLDRYFAYTFPKGDVSEQEVNNFIEIFNNLTENQIFEKIQEFTSSIQTADLFLIELRKNIKNIPSDKRNKLCLALSKNSFFFSNISNVWRLSPFSQLAVFLRELILNIQEYDEKISLSKSICKNTQPVTFGFEFLRWIEAFSRREKNTKIVSDSDFKELAKILIDRVKEISVDSVIFLDYPEFIPLIFHNWFTYKSKNEIESFLSKSFESDPNNVISFLKCYLTNVWNADGPIRGNLQRDAYNSIIKFWVVPL